MKGNEGLDFTIHPQNPCVYRHFRRKDEWMKGKIAFQFLKNPAIKIFPKSTTSIFIEILLQSISIIRKWENRMPSRFSCFAKFAKRLRKGTIVPRKGHHRARVRALLCPREAQGAHKSDTTRKSEAQISIFQRYESQTSHLHFENNRIKCLIYLSLCFSSKETLILWRYITINNLKTVGVFKLKLYFCSQKISIYMETSL